MSRFNGVICFRAFGTNITYTERFTNYFTDAEYSLIQKLGNRFWFGAGYKSIIESEGKLLKGRSLFMPLGLPNAKIDDRWIGGGKRVLFSCPKIKTEAYFNQAYTTFKNDFKNIPYVISGLQPIPVNEDPNVLGYLQKEEYDNIFITSSCMYYYSKYKTHIHYTPAEAICYGLPLLYLSGGLLDTIGGENLAGRCKSIKEVINKAQRLIDDDKKLAGPSTNM